MFEVPMIRVDKREYLERLQNGEFFMRSSLYYQALDCIDTARSDPYDGAIPATSTTGLLFSKLGISEVSNPRIMIGHTFIKCFFHYNKTDCYLIQDGVYLLNMTDDARKAVASFSAPYALVILNPSKFVEQVSRPCEKRASRLRCDDVEYLTTQNLQEREHDFLTGRYKKHPVFYKRVDFQAQQEFRFCVQVPYKHISNPIVTNGMEYQIIDSEAKKETYTMDIGGLESVSCILPVIDVLNYPVIVDTNNNSVSFLREVKYEKIGGQRD